VRAAAFRLEEIDAAVRIGERVLEESQAVAAGVGPDYFPASGVHLISGRIPENTAIAAGQPLAVVDERLAALAWPDRPALGQTISVGATSYEVAAVVTHQRFSLLRETPALAFVPTPPRNERQRLALWAPGLDAGQLRERLMPIVAALASGYDVGVFPRTFARQFDGEVSNASFQRPILTVLGLFAFSVAGIGLFGLVSYLVEQRTRDFGIRLALGARGTDITRALARESIVPALIGLALGLAAGAALQDLVRATMFGWESSGPLAIAIVCAAILAVAIVAVAGPARRVLRIDPAATLRSL
jgi:hypothetical protein